MDQICTSIKLSWLDKVKWFYYHSKWSQHKRKTIRYPFCISLTFSFCFFNDLNHSIIINIKGYYYNSTIFYWYHFLWVKDFKFHNIHKYDLILIRLLLVFMGCHNKWLKVSGLKQHKCVSLQKCRLKVWLSERERKIPYDISYMWNLKWYKWTYL